MPRRFRFLTLSLALTLTGCEAMANAFAQLLMVIIIVVSVMTALWLVLVSVNAVHLLRGTPNLPWAVVAVAYGGIGTLFGAYRLLQALMRVVEHARFSTYPAYALLCLHPPQCSWRSASRTRGTPPAADPRVSRGF